MQIHYTTILAMVPFYDSYGENATMLYLQDGTTEIIHTPIKNYLYRLLFTLHIDQRALHHWSSHILGIKQNMPLLIDENHIYLPVRMRKSIGRTDGCFGFVLGSAITHTQDLSITLEETLTLPTISKSSYIRKKQKDAALLSYAYKDFRKQYEFMRKA